MIKHAIKSGATLGAIGIVITLLLYIINPAALAIWWLGIVILIIFLGLLVFFGFQFRKEEGGYLSFGKAWMYSFQLLIVAGLISTLFNIILYNVIDPQLPEVIADVAVQNAEKMMQRFGMPADQMDEALEESRKSTIDRFTAVGQIKSFAWGLIFYAIVSLITGLILKKKKPEETI
jgi:hypothetical protein